MNQDLKAKIIRLRRALRNLAMEMPLHRRASLDAPLALLDLAMAEVSEDEMDGPATDAFLANLDSCILQLDHDLAIRGEGPSDDVQRAWSELVRAWKALSHQVPAKPLPETKVQSAPPQTGDDTQPQGQTRPTRAERFLGCMLGGAVGDALGAPVEFMGAADIKEIYGNGGITELAPAYEGLGSITDDTQMSLFTAEGLLRAWPRFDECGIEGLVRSCGEAYLRWLRSQGLKNISNLCASVEDASSILFQHPELRHRRAPGRTCLSALRTASSLGATARNDRKGCGGLMRVAPAGLFGAHMSGDTANQATFYLGCRLAGITHGHPSGYLPAGFFALVIRLVAMGSPLAEALAAAKQHLCAEQGHAETLDAVERAQSLAAQRCPPDQAIPRLGLGWLAEEALAIAVYSTLVAGSFREGVEVAVNHDGDSDSVGAIAGSLLGCLYGPSAIPESWTAPLELRPLIKQLAHQLLGIGSLGSHSESG